MLIYKIASNSPNSDCQIPVDGIDFKFVQSSRFSFITSIRLATECKHRLPDAVVVYREKDAIGALSARNINHTSSTYPIIFYVESGAKTPASLNRELATGIDAIVFETENTKKTWSQTRNLELIRHLRVIERPAEPIPIERAGDISHACLGFLGNLENTQELQKVFRVMAKMPEGECPEIIVPGTAKARLITPAIRLAKANSLPVKWLGNDFELEEILAKIDGFIASGTALTTTEKRLLANSVPLVTADNLQEWMDMDLRQKMRKKSESLYRQKYTPEKYRQDILNLIETLKGGCLKTK